MWYNIDYNILSIELLPTFLRKSRFVSFLKVLIEPINMLYYEWFIFRQENLYKLAHTGQVCYLRKVLNDEFDVELRRIRIGNGNQFERVYIFTTAEQKPKYVDELWLHPRTDYADTGVDFIVYVPLELLNTNNYKMHALINFYREGVKRYKIQAE